MRTHVEPVVVRLARWLGLTSGVAESDHRHWYAIWQGDAFAD